MVAGGKFVGIASPYNLVLGAGIGAARGVEIDARFSTPFGEDVDSNPIHEFAVGATVSFYGNAAFEIGGRLDFNVLDGGSAPGDLLLAPTVELPIVVHAGHVFRLDTGLAYTLLLPTDGKTKIDSQFGSPSRSPNDLDAGLPVRATVQFIESLYAGFDTGVGLQHTKPAFQSRFLGSLSRQRVQCRSASASAAPSPRRPPAPRPRRQLPVPHVPARRRQEAAHHRDLATRLHREALRGAVGRRPTSTKPAGPRPFGRAPRAAQRR